VKDTAAVATERIVTPALSKTGLHDHSPSVLADTDVPTTVYRQVGESTAPSSNSSS